MKHPFDLNKSDLEIIDLKFEETITAEEGKDVAGMVGVLTTMAIGEEGGCGDYFPRPPRYLGPPIKQPPYDVTTLALGEEGGSCYF